MSYEVKYIRSSKLKPLLVEGTTNIRISGEAKPLLLEVLDKAVEEAMNKVIKNLPRITKGDNKGTLKRITIMKEDFVPHPEETTTEQKVATPEQKT